MKLLFKQRLAERNNILRITLFTFFLSLLALNGFAQNIQFSKNSLTLKEALEIIEKQTEMSVDYDNSVLNEKQLIQIKKDNQPLEATLNDLLKNTGCIYVIRNNHIIISKENGNNQNTAKTIQGVIYDNHGEAIIGANVIVKGTTHGTITDLDGNFSLNAPENTTLQVSYIGYFTQEVALKGKTFIELTLREDTQNLDEVIVIGYGVQRKVDLTGAVSTVNSKDLPPSATTSAEHMLSGRTAGVQIRSTDAQPGGGIDILIRGAASVGAGNDPLYVIDGFPVGGYADPEQDDVRYKVGSRSPLSSINPNDIESIQILKDASATAIYGARAANGVILITTKQGKQGKATVHYDFKYGTQKMTKTWETMTASELLQTTNLYNKERWMERNGVGIYGNVDASTVEERYTDTYTAAEIAAAGRGTDWLNEVTRTGAMTEHNISISGGNQGTTYLASLNYYDQEGVVKNSSFNRITGRMNLTQEIRKWLTIGVKSTASRIKISNAAMGSGGSEASGVIETARVFTPTLPIRDENGDFSLVPNSSFFPNPVSLLDISNKTTQDRLFVQSFVELAPIDDLKVKAQFGFDKQNAVNRLYLPKTTLYGNSVGGLANISYSDRFDKMFNATASYKKKINEVHTLDGLIGYEWQRLKTETAELSNSGFLTDAFLTNDIGQGESERPGVGSGKSVTD
ncbi:MAG: SusC/RagA family TonB-linked outer membrane protein [Tannerellaceae bacterium]|nr:SusC/RagA family TonB-linked outer membrane protein [Tannerellaceae bacterium]